MTAFFATIGFITAVVACMIGIGLITGVLRIECEFHVKEDDDA